MIMIAWCNFWVKKERNKRYSLRLPRRFRAFHTGVRERTELHIHLFQLIWSTIERLRWIFNELWSYFLLQLYSVWIKRHYLWYFQHMFLIWIRICIAESLRKIACNICSLLTLYCTKSIAANSIIPSLRKWFTPHPVHCLKIEFSKQPEYSDSKPVLQLSKVSWLLSQLYSTSNLRND